MYVKITIPQTEGPPLAEIYETPSVRFETRPWEGDPEKKTSAHYACMIVGGRPHDALVPDSVYVMNDHGKTIEQWNPNFKPKQ